MLQSVECIFKETSLLGLSKEDCKECTYLEPRINKIQYYVLRKVL